MMALPDLKPAFTDKPVPIKLFPAMEASEDTEEFSAIEIPDPTLNELLIDRVLPSSPSAVADTAEEAFSRQRTDRPLPSLTADLAEQLLPIIAENPIEAS